MKSLITPHFFNQAKRLKKRFPNLGDDLEKSLESFKPQNETHIGKSIYKVRINPTSTNKGKSGGLRMYVYLYQIKRLLVPVCIYSKSDRDSISLNELNYHSQITLKQIAESLHLR
jgi:hypothetical protein